MVHLPQTVIGDLLIWTGTIPRRVTTMMTMIWQIWLFANPFKPRDLGETQLLGKKKRNIHDFSRNKDTSISLVEQFLVLL